MNGVRLVARLFGALGWISLAIGLVGVLVLASQFGRFFGPGADLLTGVGLLAILVASALGPFSVWAGLTALCEIHKRQEELLALHGTGDPTGPRWGRSKPLARPESREQAEREPDGTPYDQAAAATYPYFVGERVTVTKETTLHEGKQRPERAVGSVPANTRAKVLSVYEGWVRVKTIHGDVGFVEAEAVAPSKV